MPGAPQRPVPEGFREFVLENSAHATQRHFEVGTKLFRKWLIEADLVEFVANRQGVAIAAKQLPDDFAHWAAIESTAQLCKRYGAGEKKVQTWRREVGVQSAYRKSLATEIPDGFKETVARLTKVDAAKKFDVGVARVERWAAITGATFKPWKQFKHIRPTAVTPHLGSSVADRAQRHLQHDFSVISTKTIGDPRPGYIVDGRYMTTPDMIARAQRNGFDPGDWERLPAHLSKSLPHGDQNHV